MVIISLFTAVMCIFAPFTIPVGVTPLTLSTLVLYITAIIMGKYAIFPVLLYIFIGAVGLPVFSGGIGGLDKLFGPTGGFLIGYIPCAVISGYFAEKAKNYTVLSFTGIFIGTVAMYLLGSSWMIYILGAKTTADALTVIAVNILPFIPVDLAKMILALLLGYNIKKRLKL